MTAFLAALFLLTQQPTHAAIDSARVARESVARFYSWYVPAAQKAGADMRALHDARWHFSPALVTALRADSAATDANPNEIVGLDMDPFLDSQDPCDRYAPIAVRRDGKTFLVDVRGSGGCASHREPDVMVRVAFRGATPVFVNFIYPPPHNDDLLSVLKQLAADRAKKPRRAGSAHGLARSREPESVNIMMEPPVCDSVPPPLAPGERVGGKLPSGIAPTPESGTVIGVVLQARTMRPLPGVTLSFRPVGSAVGSTPVARAISNTAGAFSMTSVPPATYTLRGTIISYPPLERSVTVRTGAVDTVRVEMTYMHCVGY